MNKTNRAILLPTNLFLVWFEYRQRPPRVKICDFGLSRSYENEEKNLYTIVGTPAYMSPEVLDPKHNPDGYNPVKADIWSSGVILYAMLRGRFPFDTHQGNLKAVLRNIKVKFPFTFILFLSPYCLTILISCYSP